jgi:Putative DNA-binding domain
MTSLLELQRQFRAALLDAPGPELTTRISADRLGAEQRLQIHRNNRQLTLTQALMANFPATCRIVDEGFFRYAAAEFIGKHPPTQPRLVEYGADLPRFLASFGPASGLPWLEDLARLEWAMLACEEAAEVPALAAADLEERPAEQLAGLRLALHPACRLVASGWPIDRIRSFALNDGESSPSLDGDPVRLLVRRAEDSVRLRRLVETEFALLERFGRGLPLGEVLEQAPGDAAAILARALRDGLLAFPEFSAAREALTQR